MMFSVLMSLLLVGTLAVNTKDCPAGEEQDGTKDACKPCAAGSFTAGIAKEECVAKGTAKTKEQCDPLKRVVGANSDDEKKINDAICGACTEGYSVADSDTAADASCALNCAPGFGGTTCAACTAGTSYSDAITVAASGSCTEGKEECTDKTTGVYAVIAATTKSKAICGCAGGQHGVDCATACEKGKWLAAGNNVATDLTCADHSTCLEGGKKTEGEDGVAQWGVKTAGTAGKDTTCNLAAPTSSAAALVIPAFALIAMLF